MSSSRVSPRYRAFAFALVAASALAMSIAGDVGAAIKVACIGEQTVHSHQLTRDKEYPAMLQSKLGSAYEVGNFGDCCATLLQGYPKQAETHPYLLGGEAPSFQESIAFLPNIVVVGSWGKHDVEIAKSLYGGNLDRAKVDMDLDAMVNAYQDLSTKPRILLSLPIPYPKGTAGGPITDVILPATRAAATKHGLTIVDLYNPFLTHPELFKDDTHVTNDTGLQTITNAVYAAIMADADAGVAPDPGGPTSEASAGTVDAASSAEASVPSATDPTGGGGERGSAGASNGSGGGPVGSTTQGGGSSLSDNAPPIDDGGCSCGIVGGKRSTAPMVSILLALALGLRIATARAHANRD